jgi:hypothetical protein
MTTNLIYPDISSVGLGASEHTIRSVLTALSEGEFSEAVSRFDDHFTFIDQALDLEFTNKERLIEFFRKSRELFPDTALEIESTFAYEDHAAAEWKLTATQTESYGSQHYRSPIVARFNDRARRIRKNCAMVGLLRPKLISADRFGFIFQGVDRVLMSYSGPFDGLSGRNAGNKPLRNGISK